MRARRSRDRREVVERVCAPKEGCHSAGVVPQIQRGEARRVRGALEDVFDRGWINVTVGAGIIVDLANAQLVIGQAGAMP